MCFVVSLSFCDEEKTSQLQLVFATGDFATRHLVGDGDPGNAATYEEAVLLLVAKIGVC